MAVSTVSGMINQRQNTNQSRASAPIIITSNVPSRC